MISYGTHCLNYVKSDDVTALDGDGFSRDVNHELSLRELTDALSDQSETSWLVIGGRTEHLKTTNMDYTQSWYGQVWIIL